MVSDRRDRGQMLLIGAVVIAILIVGMVIVSNSMLYTRNIDKGGAAQSGREAAEFGSLAQEDVRSLVIRVNHKRVYDSRSELERALLRNVSTYAIAMSETYVDSRSTYVNVSLDLSESEFGARVLQADDGPFTEPGTNDGNWTIAGATPATRTDVGWLVVNLNVSKLDGKFEIRLTNASGYYEVSFERNASGYVRITSNFSHVPSANETVLCPPTRGRLLVDVLGGTVFGRGCSFNATEHLAAPYNVTFYDGDEAVGKYELVVENSSSLSAAVPSTCSPGVRVCSMPALWEANVTVVYASTRIEYRRTWDLEVYNGTHGT